MKEKIIDLTHEIYSGMDVYPGDPEVLIESHSTVEKQGYEVSRITFGSHLGTHVDAQSHMIQGGKTLSDYHVSRFEGIALYVTNPGEVSRFVVGDDKAIIVNGPKFDDGLIQKIIEKKPSMVGFFSDNDLDEEGVRKFLSEDILPVGPLKIKENLPRRFYFSAHPLNIRAGDGSPVRAVARYSLD